MSLVEKNVDQKLIFQNQMKGELDVLKENDEHHDQREPAADIPQQSESLDRFQTF